MKYLLYSNTGLTSKQLGLTAEFAEELKESGHEIKVVLCDNVLENCYFNRVHNVAGCASCQSRLRALLKSSGIEEDEILRLKRMPGTEKHDIPPFADMDELYDFSFEGINVGRGVASSVISYFRDFDLIKEEYRELIEIEIRKAINVLEYFKTLIADYQPDVLFLFNGRFSEVHPVLELAKSLSIEFYTLESGAGIHYELFHNHLPHSIASREEGMRELWAKAEKDEAEKLGREWFEKKRKGDDSIELTFIQGQNQDELPDGFDPQKRNIAIMNSSQDELLAIQEWNHELYEFQNEAIEQICRHFENQQDIHFYLRVHPNLGNVKNTQMDEIHRMNFPNLSIIPPEASVSSYKLMDACEKVISFGSSTGIEAAYWKRPSILYGRSFYENLGSVYQPGSFDELTALIEDHELEAKTDAGAVIYGYYMSCYGKKPKYFEFHGLNKSTYKGKKIKLFYPSGFWLLFRYLGNFPLWKRLHRLYYRKAFGLRSILRYK